MRIFSEAVSNAQQRTQGKCIKPKKKKSTSQFAPKETQVAYQVPFSFSHPAPSDACKAPAITRLFLKIWTKRNK